MQTRSMIKIAAVATLVAFCGLTSAFAAQAGEAPDQNELQAREAWRATMHQIKVPGKGCFHASYPSTQWEEVECAPAPGYRSALPKPAENRTEVAGNESDYVVQAPSGHLLSGVVGSFPTVTGVASEKGVGVAEFQDAGILGANEYTLQVNTNLFHSAACGSFSKCLAWEQFVMATNTFVSLTDTELTGDTEVFIEYWLLNYGVDNDPETDICPAGFIDLGPDSTGPGDDCVQNSPATLIATGQIPITDLASLALAAVAVDGMDTAVLSFGTEVFSATVSDSLTDIASGWSQAEFNVFGNSGGSRAKFNSGASLTVKVAVDDGSTAAPTCVPPSADAGTTGETNNLTLGSCTATGGSSPFIQFTESD
jgi:hypothetical protein